MVSLKTLVTKAQLAMKSRSFDVMMAMKTLMMAMMMLMMMMISWNARVGENDDGDDDGVDDEDVQHDYGLFNKR